MYKFINNVKNMNQNRKLKTSDNINLITKSILMQINKLLKVIK